jgi:hypothetical protein
MLAEDTEGLGDCFVNALGADLDGVLDTLGSRQVTLQVRMANIRKCIMFVFCSLLMLPYQTVSDNERIVSEVLKAEGR